MMCAAVANITQITTAKTRRNFVAVNVYGVVVSRSGAVASAVGGVVENRDAGNVREI